MCMVSCDSFEDKAKKQMKETMYELAKDEESFKISNIKTCISNDSLCVLQFKTKGRNGFGGFSTSRVEYVFLKDKKKDKYFEYVKDLDEDSKDDGLKKPSIYDIYKECKDEEDEYKEIIQVGKKEGMNIEQIAERIAYDMATISCMIYGRETEKE